MADAKLSELTAATEAAGADQLYLVQGGSSKKISIANLFADVATPISFSDKVCITDTGTISAPGEINVTTNVTYITDPSLAGNFTIPAGAEGQIKIIILTSNTGGHTYTMNGSNMARTVSFSTAGDSATLIYTNSKWYFIGGTATVS